MLRVFIYSQRIYGTAWESEEQLQAYRLKVEEAKRRDHRVLGKALKLFSIQEDAGGGLVFWHPKGSVVRNLIEDYWKQEHTKASNHAMLCHIMGWAGLMCDALGPFIYCEVQCIVRFISNSYVCMYV